MPNTYIEKISENQYMFTFTSNDTKSPSILYIGEYDSVVTEEGFFYYLPIVGSKGYHIRENPIIITYDKNTLIGLVRYDSPKGDITNIPFKKQLKAK